MSERRWDCLAAGIVVADYVCHPIARLPDPGTLTLTEKFNFTIGGCAANVAADLARLERKVALCGRVGTDLFGRGLIEMLEQQQVDCQHLERSRTAATSGTMVINVTGEDRRFIHAQGANTEFDGSSLLDQLPNARLLYLGGYGIMRGLTPERVAALFRAARAAGVITLLDVVLSDPRDLWEWVAPVLPYTDLFQPNQDEAELITGLRTPLDQAQRLRDAGCTAVVITQGGHGALYVGPTERWQAEVYRVPVVDGTGTGDAFVAGYVHALLAGQSTVECLRAGTAMGASCVQSMGATTGVFDRAALSEFLATHPLQIDPA